MECETEQPGGDAATVSLGCFEPFRRLRKRFRETKAREEHKRSQMDRFLGNKKAIVGLPVPIPSEPDRGFTITNLDHDTTLRSMTISELPKQASEKERIAIEFSFPSFKTMPGSLSRCKLTMPEADVVFDGTVGTRKEYCDKEVQTDGPESESSLIGIISGGSSNECSETKRFEGRNSEAKDDCTDDAKLSSSRPLSSLELAASGLRNTRERDVDPSQYIKGKHEREVDQTQDIQGLSYPESPDTVHGEFGEHVEEDKDSDELLSWSWRASFSHDNDNEDASSLASSWSDCSSLVSKTEYNQLKEALDESTNVALQNSVEAASMLTEANNRIAFLQAEVKRLRGEVKGPQLCMSKIPRVPGVQAQPGRKAQVPEIRSRSLKLKSLRESSGAAVKSTKLKDRDLIVPENLDNIRFLKPFVVKDVSWAKGMNRHSWMLAISQELNRCTEGQSDAVARELKDRAGFVRLTDARSSFSDFVREVIAQNPRAEFDVQEAIDEIVARQFISWDYQE